VRWRHPRRGLLPPSEVASVKQALANAGLDGTALSVEITESLLMSDSELAAQKLTELRSIGVGVALDDFGTGFSSLAYLRRYPVDMLKIRGPAARVAARRRLAALTI
jgi:EAL domain-containing protein (putative c-di-GMP-specific phosphodiesterase class I)